MTSDGSVYYGYKYGLFVVGLSFLFIPLISHLYPGNSTYNGEPGPPDFWITLIMVLIGLLFGLIPFLYMDKLVIAELSNQSISIKKGGKTISFSWLDVEQVKMLPALFPPLYKLRVKNYDDYFLFNTRRWGLQLLVFTWDWSEMGALIKKKKKEFGI